MFVSRNARRTCSASVDAAHQLQPNMAHANIHIGEDVMAAWHAAVDGGDATPTRYISLAVDANAGRVAVRHVGFAAAAADGADGADGSRDHMAALVREDGGDDLATSPRLWLVCLDPARSAAAKWTVISYVPEAALVKPRVKMLYAAAREDVKRTLDATRFTPDYHTTEVSELTLAAFESWSRRDASDAMSSEERAKREENTRAALSRGALGRTAAAMAAVPFSLGSAVRDTLLVLHGQASPSDGAEAAGADGRAAAAGSGAIAGGGGIGWAHIRIRPEDEQLHVTATGPETHADAHVGSLSHDQPTFLVCRLPPHTPAAVGDAADGAAAAGAAPLPPATAFVYHCPENAPPRLRMLYSTAKQRVVESAAAAGVKFTRVLEVRDADELREHLRDMAAAQASAAAAASAAGGSGSAESGGPGADAGAGDAAPDLSGLDGAFSKPSRAGRGRARIIRAP
jgi:hypothetical protein